MGGNEARELDGLDALLEAAHCAPLTAAQCECCVEWVGRAPGRLRDVAHTLAAQRSAPAVDALLSLPAGTPGVVEGLFQALRHGVVRRRPDGTGYAALLALDFRSSRAQGFSELLERARAGFGAAGRRQHVAALAFERLRVETRLHYRVTVQPGDWPPGLIHDLRWLHRRLSRLRGTRLWLNGWCFPHDGRVRPPVQVHLVEAWLDWALAAGDRR